MANGAWGNISPKQRRAIAKRVAENRRPATARATVQGRHATPKKPAEIGRGGGSSKGKEVATRGSKEVAKRNPSAGKELVKHGGKGVAKAAGRGAAAAAGVYGGVIAGSVLAGAYGHQKQKEKNKQGYYLTSGGIGASGYGTPKYEKRGGATAGAGAADTKRPIGNADGGTTAGVSGKRDRGPGLERRAQGARMGSSVGYGSKAALARGTGNTPRSKDAWKDIANRKKEGGSSIYVATGGDSWGNIAKRAGVSVDDLKKANKWQMNKRKGVIYRNSKIYIPGGSKRGQ